ncbi:helix-turn-helix transcriptional regulator [Erwinia pyri]|uniref:Helix-turn-helix transcriptional regulator n=1 Tax=Erwinia pyri TaxID=3062598 RepID=A0AA50HM50_9GAMM|nr:helix-turn-helix transcriptional regulator [Erwinia sp. DE2]WLS78831.1 helix-turn-helix transcriptional regulator [Erwinia sp. DE2]
MENDFSYKLRAIRLAEGLTQPALNKVTGLPLSSIKNYESGGNMVGLETVKRILTVERFQKYTLWLMIGKTSEAAGQISPPLAHTGRAKTESPLLTDRAG